MASTIKVDKIEGSTGSTITVPTGQTLTVTDGIPVASGGTGLASYTTGDTVYASGATAISKLGIGTARQGLQTNSGASAPEWVDSPQSLMTAAGDILYASGANTLAKLAKGSDDDVLTLASGVPSWAASAGGGKCLQVISTTKTDTTSSASTSFVDLTGITLDITPAATTSKILVWYSLSVGGAVNYSYNLRLMRDAVAIGIADAASNRAQSTTHVQPDTFTNSQPTSTMQFLDSPSTTSATTYKVQCAVENASNALYINRSNSDSDVTYVGRTVSSITAMEIGA